MNHNSRMTAATVLSLKDVPEDVRQGWLTRLEKARGGDKLRINRVTYAHTVCIYDPESCLHLEWTHRAGGEGIYIYASDSTERDETPKAWLEVLQEIFTTLNIQCWEFGEAWWGDREKPGSCGGRKLWLRRGTEIAFWTLIEGE